MRNSTDRQSFPADRPQVGLAVRLCEVSPTTGASHLVSYTFFNLAYRGGNMAKPQRIEPGVPFSLEIPLNLMGHTFKRGWRIRLALSPSFYPTLWESPEAARVTLETGALGGCQRAPGGHGWRIDRRGHGELPFPPGRTGT